MTCVMLILEYYEILLLMNPARRTVCPGEVYNDTVVVVSFYRLTLMGHKYCIFPMIADFLNIEHFLVNDVDEFSFQ